MRSVEPHRFSMVPKVNVPRSAFRLEQSYKTTFDSGNLVPFFVEEVLPGDTWRATCHHFARLATPIVPTMDNLHLDTFFFFVPNRLVWDNWVRFMGEQDNPGSSIAYTVPVATMPNSGFVIHSVQDYMGLPTVGQVIPGSNAPVNALPLRAYHLIYNEWFRDQNLQNSATVETNDGPDSTVFGLKRRGKRHDYFTSALPWPQKGAAAVTLPLGTSAPVRTSTTDTVTGVQQPLAMLLTTGAVPGGSVDIGFGAGTTGSGRAVFTSATAHTGTTGVYPSNLFADLSLATAATINQLRSAFAIQQLLELDARGGTRYTEIVLSQFGVQSPDQRLQRPEYIGGGSSMMQINPVAQTSATGLTGGSTPAGSLSAFVTSNGQHRFSLAAQEHGYIIGIVNVRADLTYQQGLRRHWSRKTRYEYFTPMFAHLGEQAVLNKEIYFQAGSADDLVFGYTERWNEYRYTPNQITGLFRSTAAGTLDIWHFAQRFTSLPTLNDTFISDTPPIQRALAVGSIGKEILFDSIVEGVTVRPLPMFSVPGLQRL